MSAQSVGLFRKWVALTAAPLHNNSLKSDDIHVPAVKTAKKGCPHRWLRLISTFANIVCPVVSDTWTLW